ncbi:MAG: SWIM zinc finger family protein [Acidimicrobiales bacterium]
MSRLRNLEAQALAELAAVMAEGARLSRGRQYVRKNNVSGLDVEAGTVNASVSGSREDPYEVTVACRLANENEREASRSDVGAAVPGALDVAFDCQCPDWGDPCKHGVAVLLAFAAEVDDDPSMLLLWRGITDVTPPAPVGTESLTNFDPSGTGAVREEYAGRPSIEPEPRGDEGPVAEFFSGKMPGEPMALLQPLEEVQLDTFSAARIEIETVDMAPVFADAIETIADHWLAR